MQLYNLFREDMFCCGRHGDHISSSKCAMFVLLYMYVAMFCVFNTLYEYVQWAEYPGWENQHCVAPDDKWCTAPHRPVQPRSARCQWPVGSTSIHTVCHTMRLRHCQGCQTPRHHLWIATVASVYNGYLYMKSLLTCTTLLSSDEVCSLCLWLPAGVSLAYDIRKWSTVFTLIASNWSLGMVLIVLLLL